MAVASITRVDLLLLGILLDRPMHGYELYQQIQTEGIDGWFNISMAGVYYSLGKLRDLGLVAESRQGGTHSARKSIYHLTEDGRASFFEAMEAQAVSREEVYLDYDLVIYLLNKVSLQRAIPLLEQRQASLQASLDQVRAELAAAQAGNGSPLRLAVLDHKRRYLEMEHGWLSSVIQQVASQDDDRRSAAGGRQGLMILQGDLHHYHLPDLIRLIASGQHNGTLTITDGLQTRSLTFHAGRPVCATARRGAERPAAPQSSEQVLEAVCDLFRWEEGSFALDQEMEGEEWCVPLSLAADELILCGCRWVDNWPIIQRLVPSAETIFELGTSLPEAEHLGLNSAEQRVMDAVDGVKDVAAIARELGLTVFETSRVCYCLAAVGILRTADLDKIRLRRLFREIAELMCSSTLAWRTGPNDRTCEEEVNELTGALPLCLNRGRIEDRAEPQLRTEELVELYHRFLQTQLGVVSRRFGTDNARRSFERTLRQLAPELQDVAKRYGFFKLFG